MLHSSNTLDVAIIMKRDVPILSSIIIGADTNTGFGTNTSIIKNLDTPILIPVSVMKEVSNLVLISIRRNTSTITNSITDSKSMTVLMLYVFQHADFPSFTVNHTRLMLSIQGVTFKLFRKSADLSRSRSVEKLFLLRSADLQRTQVCCLSHHNLCSSSLFFHSPPLSTPYSPINYRLLFWHLWWLNKYLFFNFLLFLQKKRNNLLQ